MSAVSPFLYLPKIWYARIVKNKIYLLKKCDNVNTRYTKKYSHNTNKQNGTAITNRYSDKSKPNDKHFM